MSDSAPFAHSLDAWLARQCGARTPEELCARLARRRLELLNIRLRHAARLSRFYARRLAGKGRPLTSLSEVSRLPFTTADDLRRWEDMLCVSLSEV